MRKLLLMLILNSIATQAVAGEITISDVGEWKVALVEKGPAAQEIGNPYAIANRPQTGDAYFASIKAYKLTLPNGFNDSDISHWHQVVLQDRNQDLKSLDIERLTAKGEGRRYIAEFTFDQGMATLTHGTYMAVRVDGEMYVFKYIADRENYLLNRDAVRKFMEYTVVHPTRQNQSL